MAETLFSYFRDHEADPSLVPEEPLPLEPPSPVNLRKWCASSFAGAQPMLNRKFPDRDTQIDLWATSPQRRTKGPQTGVDLYASVLAHLQEITAAFELPSGPGDRPTNGYDWLQAECVAFAGQRAALAQRTYLWLAYWYEAGQELEQSLQREPSLRKHPVLKTLIEDVLEAKPQLVLCEANQNDERLLHQESTNKAARLRERIAAARMFVGALLTLHDFLPEPGEDLPSDQPRRAPVQCLGMGTSWFLTHLSSVAESVKSGRLLSWCDDDLGEVLHGITNGSENETVPENVRRLFTELGIPMIVDAEGLSACVCHHNHAVGVAKEQPMPSVLACFVEAHILSLLHCYVDAVYASANARPGFAESPANTPKPDDKLLTKLQLVYSHWRRNYDPQ